MEFKKTYESSKNIPCLITATCFQISARSYAQNVTLEAKETRWTKYAWKSRQTGYNFLQNDCISKLKKSLLTARHAIARCTGRLSCRSADAINKGKPLF